MKILYTKFFIPLAFLFSFFFLHDYAKAQEAITTENVIKIDRTRFDEKALREKMKNDGVSQPLIDKFISERKLVEARQNSFQFSQLKKDGNPPVPFAACSDMGAETGWGAWQGDIGTANSGSQTWTPPPGAPTAPNFNLTAGAGVDPCTPGPGPCTPAPCPTIPVVAPGFGNASIQLGQQQTTGCVAEQLTYALTVTAADTNFIFAYAMVIQDAGHSVSDQPFVDLCIRDQSGNPVPCGCFRYTGGPSLPGFYQAACGFGTYYKPWTIVGVNLSAYVGQTLTITILNVDCAQCGHYAHSYWDFTCKPLGGSASAFCIGQPASICAPYDPAIAYTYQWYQNGNPYTGPPSATSQCINPTPLVGDTFTVDVMQPSGCNFTMTYVPTPMTVTPNFTTSILCGTVTFTDVSTTSNGSPITSWNWSFPGGSPASSTVQNPVVTYPAGNYTVTLIVTSQTGCTDTISMPISVTGLPIAAFSSTTVCAGNVTQFTDGSTPAAGDPIVSWSWSFPSGNPASSTSQNPTVTYPSGNFTATLTVTSQAGCTSTFTQAVTVNPLPVANLSGNNVCFNTVTTFTDLSTGNNTITGWNWSIPGGVPASSTSQNPTTTYGSAGTFTVTLIITNNFGCMDTNSITVVVNPLPIVSFSSTTVCFGNPTCFTDLSTISSGSITGWTWNFGDPNSGPANISNLQTPCHTFSAPGNYMVTLTVTSDSLCQSTTSLPIAFNPPPVAAFTGTNVCLNVSTTFTDGSTAPSGDPLNAWNWNFGDGSPNSTQQNPVHAYTSAGNYTVTLIVTTVLGCLDTISNPVTVYNLPVANFSSPDSGCSPVCQTFTDLSQPMSGNIATWQWSFPGGNPSASTSSGPTVCWDTPGSYNVTLTVMTNFGCSNTLTLPMIDVFAWPVAEFCVSPTQASVNEPNFSFCDLWSGDVTQWTWDFGDYSPMDNSSTDPVHSYSAIATNNDYYTFDICVNVLNVHGCYDSICHTVELIPEFEFYIPNCFTPNGDFINEVFFGKSRGVKEYNIWVFDRWGNLIWDCDYEGKNIDWDNFGQDGMSSACKWNGKVEGGASNSMVQEDVYVWKVRLTDIFDKKHNYIGHVSVVK